VIRLPATGSETVLDALSYINGLPPVASKERIWVSRPGGPGCPPQTLPVDWNAIVRGGETETNYQILPGDRVYVMAEPIITFDTTLARIFAPIERTLGIALLGRTTVAAFQGQGVFSNSNR
jgi:polysaccharide biosynthesis/export protein